MRWQINSEESLYTDPWLDIRVADVECDGRHLDHRLIRTAPGPEPWSPTNGAGCYSSGGTASSPIPGDGRFPLGESKTERSLRAPQRAKSRRRPAGGPGRCAIGESPADQRHVHHIFHADSATYIGPPTEEGWEAERVE